MSRFIASGFFWCRIIWHDRSDCEQSDTHAIEFHKWKWHKLDFGKDQNRAVQTSEKKSDVGHLWLLSERSQSSPEMDWRRGGPPILPTDCWRKPDGWKRWRETGWTSTEWAQRRVSECVCVCVPHIWHIKRFLQLKKTTKNNTSALSQDRIEMFFFLKWQLSTYTDRKVKHSEGTGRYSNSKCDPMVPGQRSKVRKLIKYLFYSH